MIENCTGKKILRAESGCLLATNNKDLVTMVFDPRCILGRLLAHMPNFIQIRQKTHKLEIFIFGRFWLIELVGRKMVVGISKSFYDIFAPLLVPTPNFIRIGQKTQKLEIFTFGRFWLVGLVGQKMAVAT